MSLPRNDTPMMRAPRAPITTVQRPAPARTDYRIENDPSKHQSASGKNLRDGSTDRWMDVSECAKELDVSGNTMRKMLRDDQVPVFRLNRKIRVKRSVFLDLVSKHMRPL